MEIQLSDRFTYKKLIRFTTPTIAMMIFTSLYSIVDGLFISNVTGSEAFAAINLVWPVIMLMSSTGFMFGAGGTAVISRTLGEGKEKLANEYFSLFVYTQIAIGLFFTVIAYFVFPNIVHLLGATESMQPYCVTYGRIILLAMAPMMLQGSFQTFTITANKPNLGFWFTVLSGGTNMILDFLFVYVLRWGIFGAALATAFSACMGGLVPLIYFMLPNSSLLRIGKTHFNGSILLQTMTNGLSEMVSSISMSVVSILYNLQLLAYYGSNGVAAYGVIMYVSFIFVGVFFGYASGVSPIIGYNYGAQRKDELHSLLKKSIILLAATSIILTTLSLLTAKGICSWFVSYDEELLKLSVLAMMLFNLSYLISWVNIFASAFFTSLSNGKVSAFLSFIRTFIAQIILIYALPVLFGPVGLWLAALSSELLCSFLSIYFVIRYKKHYGY